MKKIILSALVAMVLAACAKDNEQTPEEPQQVSTNWAEWNIPAVLPNDFEEILVNTPCWYAGGSERVGRIENGKVIIKNRWDLLYGGGNEIFVFDKNGWDSYSLPTFPNSTATPYHHRANLELSRDYFLECVPDSILVFTPDKITQFKEGDILRIYLMMPETKEFLEEKVMSHLEKED